MNNEVDIGISNEFGNFKYRVGLVLIKNDKLLCMKSKKHDGYVLPGGHVEFGELSSDAALREGSEELQTKIVIKDLLCIHEYLYYSENKPFNEVCFYYIINTLADMPSSDFTITENDKGTIKKHDYVWLDINTLSENNLKPNDISKLIQNKLKNVNKVLVTKEQKK